MKLLLGGVLLFAGGIVLAIGIILALNDARFSSEGRVVDGRVIGKEYVEDEEGAVDYILVYEFTAADGTRVEGRSEVSLGYWNESDGGRIIPIEHVPDDPSLNRVQGTGDPVGPIILLVIGGLLALPGLLLTLLGLRDIRRDRRLARAGLAL